MASTSTTEEFGRCPPVRAPPALLPDCLFLFFGAASGWSRGSPLALVEAPCRRESDEDNDDDDDDDDDKRDEEGKVEAMYVELDDADDDDSSEEEEEEDEEDFFVLRLGSSGAFDDRLCLRSLRWR